jgi:hypothetical protein
LLGKLQKTNLFDQDHVLLDHIVYRIRDEELSKMVAFYAQELTKYDASKGVAGEYNLLSALTSGFNFTKSAGKSEKEKEKEKVEKAEKVGLLRDEFRNPEGKLKGGPDPVQQFLKRRDSQCFYCTEFMAWLINATADSLGHRSKPLKMDAAEALPQALVEILDENPGDFAYIGQFKGGTFGRK